MKFFKKIMMRNSISLLLVVLLTTFSALAENVTISGKITNTVDGKLKIRGESFEKDITLKPDGSFIEILDIKYVGSYIFGTTNNRIAVYLAKGTKLGISADDKDFYKSLKFSGKGSMENQYIASKNAYVNAINQENLYNLNEADFLAEIKLIKKDILLLFANGKFPDGKFKESELRNIDFLTLIFIESYEKNHAHFGKLPSFKASETFPKLDAKTDLDNEADYLFSNPYKQLVNINFNKTLESKITPQDKFLWNIALPEIKKFKSQTIKNALLQALSYEISAANPDAEVLFNELNTLSTNPYFKKEIAEKFKKLKALTAGTPSPLFDYENHKGGKTSLESLKGKYVYIDVWATWCGPCIREIPALLQVEEQYKDKNIEFVSISVDAKKDYEKWKKMVSDKQMGGVQLIADNDWNSQFAIDYAIVSIPRFILIGPDGTIITADAPRPSDPALVNLLNDLKI